MEQSALDRIVEFVEDATATLAPAFPLLPRAPEPSRRRERAGTCPDARCDVADELRIGFRSELAPRHQTHGGGGCGFVLLDTRNRDSHSRALAWICRAATAARVA